MTNEGYSFGAVVPTQKLSNSKNQSCDTDSLTTKKNLRWN